MLLPLRWTLYQSGISAQPVRDLGGGIRRKVKPQLPPHLRPPIYIEEKKFEPVPIEIDLPEKPEPKNPILAQALKKAQSENNWKPVSIDMAKVVLEINKPTPIFKKKKKEFSVEDDDDEVIFLMYG